MIRLCAQLRYIQQKVLPADARWLQLIPASDQPTAPPPDPSAPNGLQQPHEAFMAAIVAKTNEEAVEAQLRAAAETAEGGLVATLAAFLHVLLVRASMSQHHTQVLLDRYRTALKNIMASVRSPLCCLRCASTASHGLVWLSAGSSTASRTR